MQNQPELIGPKTMAAGAIHGEVFQLFDPIFGFAPARVVVVQNQRSPTHVGDPSADIPLGTAFEDLPEDWICPDCGVGKDFFETEEE